MQLAVALAHRDAALARDVIIHSACGSQRCKLTLEASGSASFPKKRGCQSDLHPQASGPCSVNADAHLPALRVLWRVPPLPACSLTQSLGQGSSRACTFWAEAAIHVVFLTQTADLQM